MFHFEINIKQLEEKKNTKKKKENVSVRNKVDGENEDGVQRMTDSCGDRVVSLCRLWAESTGKF